MRVALVTNIVPPYRIPTWRALARRCGELHVFACAESEPNRVWDVAFPQGDSSFQLRVLRGVHAFAARRDWGLHFNPGLWGALAQRRPTHVLVTGYDTPSYWAAMLYARRKGLPLTLWWGSHKLSTRSPGGFFAVVRRKAATMADALVTYGTLATEQLTSLGIPPTRIVTATNTADTGALASLVDTYRARQDVARTSRQVRFLFVGQFLERKGVRELLHAFRRIPSDTATLTLVGYGPQEAELRSLVKQWNMSHVLFAGRTRSLSETARYYAESDVLVMPSLVEVWGLVVNEALAAGVYVLASNRAGATPDLVESAPLDVGRSFDPADPKAFYDALLHGMKRVRLGLDRAGIRQWGLRHTPERYAEKIEEALHLAAAVRRHPVSHGYGDVSGKL